MVCFKSWVVTKGPSLNPADKRLAVEVEDHPLDYGDFEGTIPKGQYGGGTVQLWDRGYWKPEGNKTPQDALRKGDFKFTLEGQRVKGSFVLVRMRFDRSGGKRTNWLLIKRRDEFATDGDGSAARIEDKSIASGRTMEAIAAGKGLGPRPFMLGGASADPGAVWDSNHGLAANERAGKFSKEGSGQKKSAGTARPTAKATQKAASKRPKRSPVAQPEFIPPQLCEITDRPPDEPGWAHEIKFDGYRVQMRIEAGQVSLKTRKGLDWTHKFREIAEAASGFKDGIIDGEIVALDSHGAPDFAALQAALPDGKSDDLIFFAFDLLFADGQNLTKEPLSERKRRLRSLFEPRTDKGNLRFVEHFETGGDAVLRSACKLSLEGIVSKRLDAPYRSGRGGGWLKSKCRAGHEVVVGGWTTTDGRFRSLLVGVHRGNHFVYVGRVAPATDRIKSVAFCRG